MQTVRVIIAGGGTGGHIYIGIAVARELQARAGAVDFLFVGTRRGLESRIVPQEGFRLELIKSAGLKRVGMGNFFRGLLLLPQSMIQARGLARNYAPDVVVGVGGYSSGPVVLSAWWLGIPTLIIEPNAQPGFTNRQLALVVNRAALALPDSGGYFRGKGVVTGIPVRKEFQSVPRRKRTPGQLTVLIYGGSQGSHALNVAVCGALKELKDAGPGVRWIHQTGEKDLDRVLRSYREAGIQGDVRPFLPRIYEELTAADLILSRAGAGTIAELTVAGKAGLLVPFPGAADDHQTKNARAIENQGAAKMIPEAELAPARLAAEIRHFMAHPEGLDRMEEAARKLGKPDAAARIADLVTDLAAKKKQ